MGLRSVDVLYLVTYFSKAMLYCFIPLAMARLFLTQVRRRVVSVFCANISIILSRVLPPFASASRWTR